MNSVRRSLSFHRPHQRNTTTSSASGNRSHESSKDEDSISRLPLNSFVIPRRTRYPSDQSPAPPEQFDLNITRALLEKQTTRGQSTSSTWRQEQSGEEEKTQTGSVSFDKSQDAPTLCTGPFDGPFDTKPTSRNTSGPSSSGLSGESRWPPVSGFQSSTSRNADYYVGVYNRLAKRHGLRNLQTLSASYASEDDMKQSSLTRPLKHGSRSWFLTKLTRNASSKDLRRSHSRLGRKNSLGSLLGQRAKVALKAQTLDDICRLGGVSVLDLPQKYKAVHLEMPTCLAATANYLVVYCRDTPGLFRIPGQTTVTNALYDFYVARISDADRLGSVEATVGSLSLPVGLSPSVHDVASAFKKFLWDLPGGILGSITLFESLKDICALPEMKSPSVPPEVSSTRFESFCKQDRARLIALAIVSLHSSRRVALICAVFGLLAFLKRDKDEISNTSPSRYLGPESMSSKALGVIFAPILLGSLVDVMEVEPRSQMPTDESDPFTPKRGLLGQKRTPKQKSIARQSHEIATGFERTKTCAVVAEVLILSWEDIVVEISCLTRLRETCDLPFPGDNMRYSEDEKQLPGSKQEPTHTPISGWKAKGLHSLPFPPTPSLHFDPAIHRSASVCVMPSVSVGGIHGQFQSPRKIMRSNTTLQLSDSASCFAMGLYVDRTAKVAPDLLSPAWWESKTPVRSDESQYRTKVSFPKESTMENTTLESSTRWARKADTMTDGTLESNSHRYNLSSLPDQEERDVPENQPLRLHRDISQEPVEFEEPNLQGTISSCSASVTHLAISPPNQEAFPPEQPLSVFESNSRQTIMPQCDNKPIYTAFKYSPSMIPRPVNEFARSRRFALKRITSTQEHENASTSVAPLKIARTELGEVQSFSNQYLTKQNGRIESQRPGLPHFPIQVSKSADRASYPSQDLTAHRRIPGPQMREPSVARRINFRPSPKDNVQRKPSSSAMSHQEYEQYSNHKPNVGTLYAEIRRLHGLLGARNDEVAQLKHHIDAMKRSKDSGTLSERLREAERDTRMWSCRAKWAETELFGRLENRNVASTNYRSLEQTPDDNLQEQQSEINA